MSCDDFKIKFLYLLEVLVNETLVIEVIMG